MMIWQFIKINDINETEYNNLYASLTSSRKSHIDRMKKPVDRLRSLAADYLIKKALKDLGKKNAQLETGDNGAPFLGGIDLFVSISHSDKAVVCALCDCPIGIDIEKIREVPQSLIDFTCTEEEKEYVFSGEEREKLKRFFEIWTAKEALLKKSGRGIKEIIKTNTLLIDKTVFQKEEYIITII